MLQNIGTMWNRYSCISTILILFLIWLPCTFGSTCQEHDICKCTRTVLSCICTNNENVSFKAAADESIQQILVNGCAHVEVSMGFVTLRQFKQIEFINIANLTIRPFAFVGVVSTRVLFDSVDSLNVKRNAFNGFHNISLFVMRNVKADNVESGAFSGFNNMGSIEITNSSFKRVEPLALNIRNVALLKIKNTSFDALQNKSLLISNVNNIIFDDVYITDTSPNSILVSRSDLLAFHNCYFESLVRTVFSTSELTKFVLKDSRISVCESGTFDFIKAEEYVTFTGNFIDVAKKDSILPNKAVMDAVTTKNLTLEFFDNQFTCDCGISWLWNDMYADILGSSYCHDLQNTTLDMLTPVIDSDGNCVELLFTNATTDVSSSGVAHRTFEIVGSCVTLFVAVLQVIFTLKEFL